MMLMSLQWGFPVNMLTASFRGNQQVGGDLMWLPLPTSWGVCLSLPGSTSTLLWTISVSISIFRLSKQNFTLQGMLTEELVCHLE